MRGASRRDEESATCQGINFFDERGQSIISVHSSNQRGGMIEFDTASGNEKRLVAGAADDGYGKTAAMKCAFRDAHDNDVSWQLCIMSEEMATEPGTTIFVQVDVSIDDDGVKFGLHER